MLDNQFIRAQFPAFEQAALKGQAHFENAGGSYTCRQVIDRLTRFYTERKVQPYYPHDASRLGGEEMDEAYRRLSAYLGVEEDELSFGPSTTQNTYVLSQAFRKYLNKGDAIIVTNQDHEANSGPWRRLADEGFEVREWRVNPETGSLEIEKLTELLDEKVKLVCFPHCSNLVAEINPVKQIVKLIHEAGALACVDGVSYAPHGLPNVDDLGADIYLFSSYKTYGPHQGVMVIRRALAQALPNQGHFFNEGYLHKRFTPAGPDHAQIAASAGMIDYFELLHKHHYPASKATGAVLAAEINALVSNYEQELLQPLLDYIEEKNSIRLIGPNDAEKRAATVSFVSNDHATEVAQKLAERNIIAGGGDYYAVRLMEGMGLNVAHGAVRVSFTHYTSKAEVEHLIEALEHTV